MAKNRGLGRGLAALVAEFPAGQVTLILLGWAFAQFPYLVEPDISITSAAAPQITLELLLGALIAGALLLFPSYYYLFRIFKTTE